MGAQEIVELIPAGMIDGAPSPKQAMLPSPYPTPRQQPERAKSEAGSIEIALANGSSVMVYAFVDEQGLSRVFRAMQGVGAINLAPGTKIFFACRPIDLRSGFNGLAAKTQQVLGQDPFICVGNNYVAALQRGLDFSASGRHGRHII